MNKRLMHRFARYHDGRYWGGGGWVYTPFGAVRGTYDGAAPRVMRGEFASEGSAAEPICDLSARSDFPCAGQRHSGWTEGIIDGYHGPLTICEEHRRRMLNDIQDEWAREKER